MTQPNGDPSAQKGNVGPRSPERLFIGKDSRGILRDGDVWREPGTELSLTDLMDSNPDGKYLVATESTDANGNRIQDTSVLMRTEDGDVPILFSLGRASEGNPKASRLVMPNNDPAAAVVVLGQDGGTFGRVTAIVDANVPSGRIGSEEQATAADADGQSFRLLETAEHLVEEAPEWGVGGNKDPFMFAHDHFLLNPIESDRIKEASSVGNLAVSANVPAPVPIQPGPTA